MVAIGDPPIFAGRHDSHIRLSKGDSLRHIAQANDGRAIAHLTQDKRRAGQPREKARGTGGINQHVAAVGSGTQ